MATEYAFTVGSAEKHDVQIRYGKFWATMRISVDGRLALTKSHPIWVPKRCEYSIDVGGSEAHHIVVERIRPTWGSKVRPQKFTVCVDGVESGDFTG
jgi:hypothetical protein